MGILSEIKNLLPHAIDILFPPRCLVCERDLKLADIDSKEILPPFRSIWERIIDERAFCPTCFSELPFIRGPVCARCGSPLSIENYQQPDICGECLVFPPPFISAISLGFYGGSLQKSIELLKYRNQRSIARPLGHLLSIVSETWIKSHAIDVILPIPLHKKRIRERGYNQSALIARAMGSYTGLPVEIDSLIRVRNTMPQVSLRINEREKNVKGAFKVRDPERIKGKRVLLLDDVITTGSTIKEATKSLISSGIEEVFVITIARVMRI
jgi:ComF family protein